MRPRLDLKKWPWLQALAIQWKCLLLQFVQLYKDLLHPSVEEEKGRCKLKRLVQSPNSYFMDVKCPGMCFAYSVYVSIIIMLEARLQPNIGFASRHILALFMRSAITPLKANWFGWNVEHSEYIVRGLSWQILGTIRAVSTAGVPGEIFFLWGKQCTISLIPVCQISWHLNAARSVSQWKLGTEFWKFYCKGFLTSNDFRMP